MHYASHIKSVVTQAVFSSNLDPKEKKLRDIQHVACASVCSIIPRYTLFMHEQSTKHTSLKEGKPRCLTKSVNVQDAHRAISPHAGEASLKYAHVHSWPSS